MPSSSPANPSPVASPAPPSSARQVAFLALRAVQRSAFADVALDRSLQAAPLVDRDRRLVTELVYGCVRYQRLLNALIDRFVQQKPPPPELRLILQLGLYQLRYMTQIPASAAVNTTVELAKQNGFAGLAGWVNALLRGYLRSVEAGEPLPLPTEPIARLALEQSYPDWLVQRWVTELGWAEAEQLCRWFNRPPKIDLRINPLQASIETVAAAMQAAGVAVQPLSCPPALQLPQSAGAIQALPGFAAGEWTVQDASAQLVSHLLDPQPGELVIDACAAPGGKTTHLAELMQDRGQVLALDCYASRLKKVRKNADRLRLTCIQTRLHDSQLPLPNGSTALADRLLLDVPCSGLGTLHRHADARWRQSPETIAELTQLQAALLRQTATWVKPGGCLVYATCTVNSEENEAIVQDFLERSPNWRLEPPQASMFQPFLQSAGWLKIWPHRQEMDGFFMAKLRCCTDG